MSSAVSGGTRTEPSDVSNESIAPEEEDVKPEADLQATIQQLNEQVARLTDRLDGRESQTSSGETGAVAAENDQDADYSFV